MSGKDYFDQAADTWDLAEPRVALALGVAKAIRERVALSRTLEVLDFGCGTGLVTLALAQAVGAITGADSSPAMLEVLAEKAQALGIAVGLQPVDSEVPGKLGGPYDLIVSSMTLHHLADIPALFGHFAAHLRPGGRVALADLDTEDGGFHAEASGVHHQGFAREQIQAWLQEAGFQEVRLETATVARREERDYPVFLATARKSGTFCP